MNGIQHLHSTLRWVVLILLVLSIVKAFSGMSSGRSFGESDRKRGLFTMISLHLQLVLGFLLYFLKSVQISGEDKPWYKLIGTMDDARIRFFSLEHMVLMVLAVGLGTLGYSFSKRAHGDSRKFKQQCLWFSIALILILLGIPWPFREELGDHGWI